MILNGNFYTGAFGYAGELGLVEASFNGEKACLDEFISLRSIKKYVENKDGVPVVTVDVINKYHKDKEFHNYIISTAHLLGRKIKDILEILNFSKIVIQGRVTKFGHEYLNAIKEEVGKSQNQCDVCFSTLNGDSIFLGAMSLAVDNLIDATTQDIMKEGVSENE